MTVPSSVRGRPKDLDKRSAMLKAATRLFVARGFAGTSMDAIAREAEVSKVTLYSHFSDKDSLFREAVVSVCRSHLPEQHYDLRLELPLPARFRRIAEGFFDLITSKEALSVYRMMAGSSRGSRKLATLFWSAGPEPSMRLMAQSLEAAAAAGELQVEQPRRAASHFFCLVKGEYHLKLLVGAITAVSAEERRAHIDDVVRMFLRAYAPRG